jgi:hypothetical protein
MIPEDLQKELDKLMQQQNSRSIPEFEGYSPDEMHELMYAPFFMGTPIQLKKLPTEDYQKVPIFRLFKNLADIVSREKELKLTTTGALPVKYVCELYQKSDIKDFWIESGLKKLRLEGDCESVHLTRILFSISGVAKIRKNKLSLTKKGEKILADDHLTLQTILEIFGHKFNWAYLDGFGDNMVGQRAFAYSLVLLSIYGSKSRPAEFYANKYFRAFPAMIDEMDDLYRTKEARAMSCYISRTFSRFLDYLGLIEPSEKIKWNSSSDPQRPIIRTDLFDKMLKCQAPLKKKNYH